MSMYGNIKNMGVTPMANSGATVGNAKLELGL